MRDACRCRSWRRPPRNSRPPVRQRSFPATRSCYDPQYVVRLPSQSLKLCQPGQPPPGARGDCPCSRCRRCEPPELPPLEPEEPPELPPLEPPKSRRNFRRSSRSARLAEAYRPARWRRPASRGSATATPVAPAVMVKGVPPRPQLAVDHALGVGHRVRPACGAETGGPRTAGAARGVRQAQHVDRGGAAGLQGPGELEEQRVAARIGKVARWTIAGRCCGCRRSSLAAQRIPRAAGAMLVRKPWLPGVCRRN